MSDNPPEKPENNDFIKGQVRHQQISARVPEDVARGVFCTGAIVLVGTNEFILDFVVRMAQPHQVAARVVLPHNVMPQLIGALSKNVEKFRNRYGDPPEMPKAPPPKEGDSPRPTIQDVYDDLKLPDETLAGAYANAVMISHSPAEFCFDFITNFFPRSCVSARIYISAAQVPRMLEAIQHTYAEFQKRIAPGSTPGSAPGNNPGGAQGGVPRMAPRSLDTTDLESPYYPPKDLPPADDHAPNEQIVGPEAIDEGDAPQNDEYHDDEEPFDDGRDERR